jgi:hypothetical protein
MENGDMVIYPANGGKGNLYTKDEFSDFVYRFEFQLTPGANNGLGIRTPMEGDAAYVGMELQILDNDADIYKNLQVYQYHGSVYGIIPAKRGALKPAGEWNYQEVVAQGNRIKVTLNGTVILDGDIAEASKNNTATADHKKHPGLLNKKGHIAYLGHGAVVRFKNNSFKLVVTGLAFFCGPGFFLRCIHRRIFKILYSKACQKSGCGSDDDVYTDITAA